MAPDEQGLAGGMVIASFQFGGALDLAVTTAVNEVAGSEATSQGLLDGYHAALERWSYHSSPPSSA
ncbi:MAG: hypothetical protein ACYC2O_07260 [Microthrixaceae bacterium]